jgi:PAS domain S-box-containing protein
MVHRDGVDFAGSPGSARGARRRTAFCARSALSTALRVFLIQQMTPATNRNGEPAGDASRINDMDASEATHADVRASVTVDRKGIIHQWGDAVTEVVGYSAEEALGRSLNIVIPAALRPVHWWGFDQAMKSGRLTKDLFKVPALCKDGRIIVAHATIDLTAGKSGETDGAVVTFVGVGAPWQGKAWQAALIPVDAARRIWQRVRRGR